MKFSKMDKKAQKIISESKGLTPFQKKARREIKKEQGV